MKMFFYRGRRPNFGDELNVWLAAAPSGVLRRRRAQLFIGVDLRCSTISLPTPARSSRRGLRGLQAVPAIDERWQLLRARTVTAAALGLDEGLGVGDTAIIVRSCMARTARKTHRISFMPHWQSAADGHWAEASRAAGLHYIDPCDSVENVLTQIQESEVLVSEAMHGAIVADALRVPWTAVHPDPGAEPGKVARLGVGAGPDPPLGARVPLERALKFALSLTGRRKHFADRLRARGQRLQAIAPGAFKELASRSLARRVAGAEPAPTPRSIGHTRACSKRWRSSRPTSRAGCPRTAGLARRMPAAQCSGLLDGNPSGAAL